MDNAPESDVVLLVEDDPLVRLVAADLLSDAGFRVVEAETADAAIGVLEARDDIRVVVTDVRMPGKRTGLDLAEDVRNRWPGTPVLITSGYLPPSPRPMLRGASFLAKPYDVEELVQRVRRMVKAA